MNIVCISLVYEKLSLKDKKQLDNILKIIQMSYEKLIITYERNKNKYYGIDSPIIINKCNGTLLVAETLNINKELAIKLLKKLWLDCIETDNLKIFESLVCKIKGYHGKDALIYLAETTVGMHSLVYGDIQVYSQVETGLKFNNNYNSIVKLFNELMLEIRKNTSISNGNVSLERVLADCVEKDGIKEISLFGYGKSGKLIAKALSEKNIIVNVFSRKKNIKHEKNINFKKYDEIDDNEKFHCIIALENNESTLLLINHFSDNMKNIYDISSPSLVNKIKVKSKLMKLDDFTKIGKENETIRKKGHNTAQNIILKHINNYLFNIVNDSLIKFDLSNAMSKDIINLRNILNLTIRELMNNKKFIEVDIPTLLNVATESEESAFSLIFNNEKYYLKQSSQLLLQILVNQGFTQVYDISHVFRNENIGINNMYQFQLFTCEWQNNSYDEIEIFFKEFIKELLINNIEYNKSITMSYDDTLEIINENLNNKIEYGSDFDESQLLILSNFIKKKYNTNFFIINKYPINFKKFYHSLDINGRVNTFKAYYKNVCYASGGQRSTNKDEIEKELYLANNYIDKYKSYIEILNKNINHGGFSVSIDALIKIILELSTTNNCKLFKNIQL